MDCEFHPLKAHRLLKAIVSAGLQGIYTMPSPATPPSLTIHTLWADAPGTHPRHVQAAAHLKGTYGFLADLCRPRPHLLWKMLTWLPRYFG